MALAFQVNVLHVKEIVQTAGKRTIPRHRPLPRHYHAACAPGNSTPGVPHLGMPVVLGNHADLAFYFGVCYYLPLFPFPASDFNKQQGSIYLVRALSVTFGPILR